MFAREKYSKYYLFLREAACTGRPQKSRGYKKGSGFSPFPNALKENVRETIGMKSIKGSID